MNIYSPDGEEGVIDIRAARDELKRTGGMSPNVGRLAVAEIAAAAQLDIAASLRIIAREAALAMASDFAREAALEDIDPEGVTEDARFEVGNRVTAHGGDVVFEIADFGVDQDEPYAKLVRDLEDGEITQQRVWVKDLAHADDDGEEESGEYKPTEAELAEHEAEKYGTIDRGAEADDDEGEVEADFESPLEALAKKHAPKKGKKK